jgi:hypothetical protein
MRSISPAIVFLGSAVLVGASQLARAPDQPGRAGLESLGMVIGLVALIAWLVAFFSELSSPPDRK